MAGAGPVQRVAVPPGVQPDQVERGRSVCVFQKAAGQRSWRGFGTLQARSPGRGPFQGANQAPARPWRPDQRIRASRIKGQVRSSGRVLEPHTLSRCGVRRSSLVRRRPVYTIEALCGHEEFDTRTGELSRGADGLFGVDSHRPEGRHRRVSAVLVVKSLPCGISPRTTPCRPAPALPESRRTSAAPLPGSYRRAGRYGWT